MGEFTDLEQAALHSIFSEAPGLTDDLERQLEKASVTSRENTGGGFFTAIMVPDDAPQVSADVLGYETHAHVDGIEHGLGFVLFMEDGKLHLLEAYACGPESTAHLDPSNLSFEVFRRPVTRLG